MDTSLKGRVALITGSSQGLGFAMGRAFYEAGASVALVARRPDLLQSAKLELEALSGGRVGVYVCDVEDGDAIARTHAAVVDELGPVDILVNNAGRSAAKPFMELTDEDWQSDIDLKLFAAIRLTRMVWPHMAAQNHGRIINVLNTAAKAPPPKSSPTSVSRAAGMALMKVLAGEGAPHNILVNALMIGFIKSDQIVRMHAASDGSKTLEEFITDSGARLPMGRMGEAHECANLALFLASDAASYVTGCAINMDGGLSNVV